MRCGHRYPHTQQAGTTEFVSLQDEATARTLEPHDDVVLVLFNWTRCHARTHCLRFFVYVGRLVSSVVYQLSFAVISHANYSAARPLFSVVALWPLVSTAGCSVSHVLLN